MTTTLRFALPLALALALVAVSGCDKNKGDELSAAPPPDASASTDPYFEPVSVTPPASGGYVEPAPVAAPPASGGSTYTIQKGDTLWSIARRHYGSGQRWQDIVNANPGLDPQKLPVGKTITLP